MITGSKYKAAKILFDGGAKAGEVSEYLNISLFEAGKVNKSENYEEYQNDIIAGMKKARDAKGKNNQKKETKETKSQEVIHTVQVQATHYMMEELKAQTELLKGISAKLALFVDELTK